MRDWVRPHLIQRIMDEIKSDPNGSEETKEEMIKLRSKEIEHEELEVYSELMGELQYDFGRGIAGEKIYFEDNFGEVLSNIPEEAFKKLSQMKNLFFLFTPHEGATWRTIPLNDDLKATEGLKIVNFPFATVFKSPKAIRGTVVHELAHIFAEHDLWKEENENEADEIARSWGFEEEIKALNDYWAELEAKSKTED